MKIELYPKAQLESTWKRDKEQYARAAVQPPLCLRCGRPLHQNLSHNVLSRHIDVKICSGCGADEAVRAASGQPLPLLEWQAVKNGLLEPDTQSKIVLLTPICSFAEIFEQTKQDGTSALEHPVSEVAYSRSDYDGRKWWSTWFDCQKERPKPALCQEIDQFQNALFNMPELKTLDTMRRLCSFAESTTCESEFNLYSETSHFHIWLWLITRFRDYNLYVHYYCKQQV
ncbi:hypothetical protein [Hungatella hathewayi]|uniref:hypothetical protein n=1 Tax=Hungatella hathewayi TaxID=154046 RepID=UPI0016523C79|nr:hypothetical protein [Hungatella hathewayi]